MARSRTADHLQVYSFDLVDITSDGSNALDYVGGPEGGINFSGISGIDWTMEVVPIEEGNFPITRHILKRSEYSSITLSRGMMPKDSAFYLWATAAVFGDQFVRRHFLLRMRRPGGDGTVVKSWSLYDCIPVRVKLWPDLDAKSGEVAIAELEIQPDWVEEDSHIGQEPLPKKNPTPKDQEIKARLPVKASPNNPPVGVRVTPATRGFR